jgi:hypothetical protein
MKKIMMKAMMPMPIILVAMTLLLQRIMAARLHEPLAGDPPGNTQAHTARWTVMAMVQRVPVHH